MTGLVAASVAASVSSNSVFGRGIGNTSCQYRMSFSPSRRAFGIWGIIYPMSVASLVEQGVTHAAASEPLPPPGAVGLYALSWLASAFWVPTFSAKTGGSLAAAAAFLCCTASFSLAATFYASPWTSSPNEARRWVTGVAYSSLAGWTTVASALNIGIAAKANDPSYAPTCVRSPEDYTILSDIKTGENSLVPLFLSCAIAVPSILVPDPILPIPVAWAVFFMRPSYWNYAALALLVSSVGASFVRVYVM